MDILVEYIQMLIINIIIANAAANVPTIVATVQGDYYSYRSGKRWSKIWAVPAAIGDKVYWSIVWAISQQTSFGTGT